MMKTKILLLIVITAFSYKSSTQNDCDIPNRPVFIIGFADIDNPINCGTKNIAMLFNFSLDKPFSTTLIIENVTTHSSSTYHFTGSLDEDDGYYYGNDVLITFTNGHLIKFYLEYSATNYYCKKLIYSYGVSHCSDIDEDGDGFFSDIDLNDNNPNDYPFGPEYCDGYDNNYNGLIDDADPAITDRPFWYLDEDGDTYPKDEFIRSCVSPGEKYLLGLYNSFNFDCDDTDPDINPTNLWYQDIDGDGYASQVLESCASPVEGWFTKKVLPLGDCDDGNPNINPGKIEIPYNSIDDDCDIETDDNTPYFAIPDPNFEQALVDLGIDTDGIQNNLIAINDFFNVTHLDLSFPETNENLPNVNGKITDLSGIQLFYDLIDLNISGNSITDLSDLTGSNISGKSSNSKNQTTSNITGLKVLNCSNNNLTSLDISNMSELNSLNCSYNQLEYLNVQNGINSSFVSFNTTNNNGPNCINVDNASYSTSNWTNIDSQTVFSENCAATLDIKSSEWLSKKITIFPNPVSKILNIKTENSINVERIMLYNMLGQPIHQPTTNKIDVSNFQSGLYLLKIETDKGNISKRVVIK